MPDHDPETPRKAGYVGEILTAIDQTTFDERRVQIAARDAIVALNRVMSDTPILPAALIGDRALLWKIRARLLDAESALARLDGLQYGGPA